MCKNILTKKLKEGMTSIELVVVFSIFAALAATVLFSYREFSTNIKLQNLTQDIALQIRESQNRSVSGIYPSLAPTQDPVDINWSPSYGLFFSKNPEAGANKRFTLFFDRNSSAVSDPQPFNMGNRRLDDSDCNGTASECLDIIQITGGEFISDICIDQFTYGGDECYSVDTVDVVFVRPLNRAYISYEGMNEGDFISDVSLYLQSPSGAQSVVRVTATGQIIVE